MVKAVENIARLITIVELEPWLWPKTRGGGALSHEWFHSFDQFISTRFLHSTGRNDFASALWLKNHQIIQHQLNSYLDSCYQHIFLKPNSDEISDLLVKSAAADKAMNTHYYALPQELIARAFEAYVEDHFTKNAFLAQDTKQSPEAKMGIYSTEELRTTISESFLDYFYYLGGVIKT